MRRAWIIALALGLSAALVRADGDHPSGGDHPKGPAAGTQRPKAGKPKAGPNWAKSVEEACTEAKDRNCPIFVYYGMDG